MNVQKLKEIIKDKGMTIHKLAIQSELSYSTVYDIIHGNNTNPKLDTILRITETLGVELNTILKEGNNEKNCAEDKKNKV